MRSGLALLVTVFLLALTGPAARAQPAPVTLIAAGNADVASQRFAKHVATEYTRRAQPVVSETDAAALLGRPLAAAITDCSGDDLCFGALGQVVNASQVLVLSAAVSPKDPTKYDCLFRIIDVKAGKTRGPMIVTGVPVTDQGLVQAAFTVAENVSPRPRLTAATTPTPLVSVPTPVIAPTPSPTAVAIGTAPEPTPTPGTALLDAHPPKPRPRPPLLRDPAFWSVAGAGALVVGVGAFLAAGAVQKDESGNGDEGTSTVEVRF